MTGEEVWLGAAVSQYKELYYGQQTIGWACHDTVGCIVIREKAEGLAGRGHDTINCIVTWKVLAVGKIWSRYKDCNVTKRRLGSWALGRDLGHDTAVPACSIGPRHGHLRCDTTRGLGHYTARHGQPQGHNTAPARAPGHTWACRLAKAVHLVHPASFWTQYCF